MSYLDDLASVPILERMIGNLSIRDIDNMILVNPRLENKLLSIKAYQDILYVKSQIEFFINRLKKLVNQEVNYVKFKYSRDLIHLGVKTIDKSGAITGIENKEIFLNWSSVYDVYIINFLDGQNVKEIKLDHPEFFDLLEKLYREENRLTFYDKPISIDVTKDVFLKIMMYVDECLFYFNINPEFIKLLNPFLKQNLVEVDEIDIINDTEIGDGDEFFELKDAEGMYPFIQFIISNGFVPKVKLHKNFNIYDVELAFYIQALLAPE